MEMTVLRFDQGIKNHENLTCKIDKERKPVYGQTTSPHHAHESIPDA